MFLGNDILVFPFLYGMNKTRERLLLQNKKTYQLIQQAGANTFVSMRAAGVLFDAKAVPEPSGFLVAVLGGTILMVRRRRA